jgi:hypothetical protein
MGKFYLLALLVALRTYEFDFGGEVGSTLRTGFVALTPLLETVAVVVVPAFCFDVQVVP